MMIRLTAIALVLAAAGPGHGQDTQPATDTQDVEETAEPQDVQETPEPVVTHHTITLDDQPLNYTATTGTIALSEEDGTEKARVFFVAYTLDDADPGARPITFTFNGGPGSSSVWLHLGAFGPRRVALDDVGRPVGPPYTLIDNEGSILDLTDLVFIDPVTTGYSRAVPGEDDGQFHGVNEDVESVGEFIRRYTTKYERWSSPKFLSGESYGTTRAAGLAGHLQQRHGMFLNGIVLVSSILNFQTARFNRGNDQAYLLLLPTCTATAWYHGRLDDDLQQDLGRTLAEVEAFVSTDYTLALMRGADLPEDERREIARRVARYTGLTEQYVLQANLRLSTQRFTKELLRDERRTVGRLDSRFIGIDYDAAGEGFEYDPSYAAIQGPYTAMLNDYVRTELGYESDLTYEILTGRVHPWNYGNVENRYLNVAETLRRAMTRNPGLRVFIASGYYDMATPYFATDYTVSHLGLDPQLRDHVEIAYYESGHMMYIHRPSLLKLKDDLAGYFEMASTPSPAPELLRRGGR
jgi:carboxypeptidase C (cathepsin A)